MRKVFAETLQMFSEYQPLNQVQTALRGDIIIQNTHTVMT